MDVNGKKILVVSDDFFSCLASKILMLEIRLLSFSTFQGSQKIKAANLSYDNLFLEPLQGFLGVKT